MFHLFPCLTESKPFGLSRHASWREVQDERNPLLERVKFFSIFGSNMDEFFMVRVSGIRQASGCEDHRNFTDGMTPPASNWSRIRKRSLELFKLAHHCYQRELLPQLDKQGIHILEYKKLSASHRRKVDDYFCNVVYPILTPWRSIRGHPFPHISNLSLNLAIVIRNEKGEEKIAPPESACHPAIIITDQTQRTGSS